jgi:hypothetical protein
MPVSRPLYLLDLIESKVITSNCNNLGGTADITIRPFIGMSSFFTLRLKFIVYTKI